MSAARFESRHWSPEVPYRTPVSRAQLGSWSERWPPLLAVLVLLCKPVAVGSDHARIWTSARPDTQYCTQQLAPTASGLRVAGLLAIEQPGSLWGARRAPR